MSKMVSFVGIVLMGLCVWCNMGMGAIYFPGQFQMNDEDMQKLPWNIQDKRLNEKLLYHLRHPSQVDMEQAVQLLKAVLMENWDESGSPILYIEEDPQIPYERSSDDGEDRNKRARYDPHNPYICSPSKQDVYRLLMELHGAQDGLRDRPVSFCNRKRPAHAIFNHIRFLGKKK